MEKKEEDCAHGLHQQEWYWANASKEEIATAICVSLGLVTEGCAKDHIWLSSFVLRNEIWKKRQAFTSNVVETKIRVFKISGMMQCIIGLSKWYILCARCFN